MNPIHLSWCSTNLYVLHSQARSHETLGPQSSDFLNHVRPVSFDVTSPTHTVPISSSHKHGTYCFTFPPSVSGRHINSSQILQRAWERRLRNFPSQRKQEATISPTYVLFFRRADPLQRQRFTFEIGWDTLLFRSVLFFPSVRNTATAILDGFTLS